jgi:hypothetical protein
MIKGGEIGTEYFSSSNESQNEQFEYANFVYWDQ